MSWGACKTCGKSFATGREYKTHEPCGPFAGEDIVVRRRSINAQWDDGTAVMVHVHDKTGEIRYVGSHDAKLKDGYHREYLKSLPEVNKFEREHKVVNHVMHFDSNGRALDDTYRGEAYNH